MFSRTDIPRKESEEVGEHILTKAVKAGRRTYFFDVRATRGNDYYLTITESRKTTVADGSVVFDRYKIFLYKEDFARFDRTLREVLDFIAACPCGRNHNLQADPMTNYLLLALKGCAMGMADVIPGVSGGTIAFISGIYTELIESIKKLGGPSLRLLATLRLREFWREINGNFLAAVFVGILVAVFSLARAMTYLLEHHPIEIWAFFFGLIVASALLVARDVTRWNAASVVSLLCGIAVAWWITVASPSQTPETWWFILLSGAIAICAMILPGISGAFILLLMGKYQFILNAVSSFDIGILALFATGAVAGLVSFSHVLSWLLRRYHDVTISLLMGFMVGSLNKVWPWKETLESYFDSHGAAHPLVERNVLPATFTELTGTEAQVGWAVALCACGFLLIWGIEYVGNRIAAKKGEA